MRVCSNFANRQSKMVLLYKLSQQSLLCTTTIVLYISRLLADCEFCHWKWTCCCFLWHKKFLLEIDPFFNQRPMHFNAQLLQLRIKSASFPLFSLLPVPFFGLLLMSTKFFIKKVPFFAATYSKNQVLAQNVNDWFFFFFWKLWETEAHFSSSSGYNANHMKIREWNYTWIISLLANIVKQDWKSRRQTEGGNPVCVWTLNDFQEKKFIPTLNRGNWLAYK